MDDVGTLVAKLALRSKLISDAQFEKVSQAYAKSGGRKPYGAILLETGILTGGALTRLLHDHQRRISELIEKIFTGRILEKSFANEDSLREVRATLDDIRLHGFDFDMLELLVKRNAITHAQAGDLRQYLRTKVLICPICLRTEPRNGHEGTMNCPDCHEEFSPGASDRLMSRFVTVAAMFPSAPGPGTPPPESLTTAPGSDVPAQLGAYRVAHEVGRGGMAVVYQAEDLRNGTRVALKVLKPGSALDKSNLSRFYSEIESLQKLDHPNIVRVLGVGESAGHHFYAMQFIDGRGLDRMVNECKQDLRRTAAWVRDVGRALHSAHDRGIVHRDVKPGNVLVDREGKAFLTDFGLALRERAVRVTMSGTTLGTPNFMSPEQARGERHRLDRRTDVYSLGASLYNLCTGRVPYWENTPELVVQKILNEEPRPPAELNPSIDKSLQTIILKAMDKEPERRYASAAEFADDLQRWLSGEPIHATPTSTRMRAWKWWMNHRRTILIAGGSAAAASLVAGLLFLNQLNVTETMASELSRAESERERIRQGRIPADVRFAEDRARAAERAQAEYDSDFRRYEDELREALGAIRIKAASEKRDPSETQSREAITTVEIRREFAAELNKTGESFLRKGEVVFALQYLKKAEQVYQDLSKFQAGITDKKVAQFLKDHTGFREHILVVGQLQALREPIARAESQAVWMQWLADKDTSAALLAMDKIVREFSGLPEPLIRRGLIHARRGQPQMAAADFSTVLLKDPKNFAARLGLAEVRLRQGDPAESANELSRLPESKLKYGPEFALIEGHRLLRAGDPAAALAVFEYKQAPGALPDLIAGRALCLQALGRFEDAGKAASKAEDLLRDLEDRITLDSARLTGRADLVYEIASTLARSHHARRQITEARAAARRALNERPGDAEMLEIIRGVIR